MKPILLIISFYWVFLFFFFFAPNASLPATVPACHLPTGSNLPLCRETEHENGEQGRGQEPVAEIALQLPALCLENHLVLQTHFCVLGDVESFKYTGGNGAQLKWGECV